MVKIAQPYFNISFYPGSDFKSFLLQSQNSELVSLSWICPVHGGVCQILCGSGPGCGCAVHEALNVLVNNLHSIDRTAVYV